MAASRKCCDTPRGHGPHRPGCPNANFKPPPPTRRRRKPRPPLGQHFDKNNVPKKVRREILDDVFGDLPDGAYFGIAEEMGLTVEDLTGEGGDAE